MEAFKSETSTNANSSASFSSVKASHLDENGQDIEIKPGVVFYRLKPQIYGILGEISQVFKQFGYGCVITSAHDGVHKGHVLHATGLKDPTKVSKHYLDLALDFRSKHIDNPLIKHEIFKTLKEKFGDKYTVLFEFEGEQNEHFHLGLKV